MSRVDSITCGQAAPVESSAPIGGSGRPGRRLVLAALAASEEGQLVVASHAPEVWRHFEADQAFVELPPRAVSPARLPLD